MKTKLRFMALVLLGIMLSVNQVWGAEYEYTAFSTVFAKGTQTINGTNISGSVSTSIDVSTYSASNNLFTAKATSASNVYYNANQCGLRVSKSKGAGSIQFTLSDALQDSTIYAIVIYASKVSGNTKATCVVTPTAPTGGYTTETSFENSQLTAYSSTFSGSNYKLDTIKVGGKKLTTIQIGSASGGYTHIHQITLVTQTPKASTKTAV